MKSKFLIVFLVLSFRFSAISCVCNITALSSVDAITVNKEGVTEKHYGVNFNLMDGYRAIYVTKANVNQLCEGIVKFFNKLEELNLIGINISSIEKFAFQHVPKLTKLSLAVNNLTEFKSGYVNEIKTLKVLYLTSNLLRTIDDDAFNNMIHLKRIYLNRNELTNINGAWFRNCSKLELIDLSHNKITRIPSGAFQNLRPTSYDHFVQYKLGFNQISSISPEALDTNKEFLILRLDSNRLMALSLPVFKNIMRVNSLVLNSNYIACMEDDILKELKTSAMSLHLVNNPLQCDCMDKFDKFLIDNSIQATFYYNTTFNCQLLKQIPIFS
ncbi:hypothetical protein HHI36_009270 [Cryptolaemus montrouzieri]|uniref:Uncharacterized protein n=1 Tax=Cryptolaemus montrouzieri TaxID=559131 RepID=A0ABD2MVM3_9CUCU